MTTFFKNRNTILFLAIIAVLLIFSLVAIWGIISQQRQLLLKQEQHYYHSELDAISTALNEHTFDESFIFIINYLNNIIQQHTHIATLKAVAKNDFELFNYSRSKSPHPIKKIYRRINFDTDDYLDITIELDFSEAEWILASLYKKLLLTFTVAIIILGITLWFIIKKLALEPLKLEKEQQKARILRQANHDLRMEIIKNQRMIQIIEKTNDMISWATPEGQIIYTNQAGIKLLGCPLSERRKIKENHPAWAKDVILNQAIPTALREGIWKGETALLTCDGKEIPTSQVIMSHTSSNGEVEFISTIIRDISEQKQAKQAIIESEKRFKALFDTMTSGVAVYDVLNDGEDFTFKDFNKAAEKISNVTKAEIMGRRVTDVFPGVKAFGLFEVFQRVHRTGKAEHFPVTFYQDERLQGWRENYVYKLDSGEIVAIHDDITERKQLEDKLKKQAEYDSLTGLPNRMLFRDRLSQFLAMNRRCSRHFPERVALLFIDLDRFKEINDTLGHDAGDQLLRLAAERIVSCVRKSDTVARLGGDEFTIILPDLTHQMDAELVARKIMKALTKSFSIFGEEIFISGSIGITIFPDDGSDIEEMIKNADSAMYHAKADGRNKFRFFTAEMNIRARQRMNVEKDLRSAIENEELSVHYQAKVDILSRKIVGMEALVRWEHPESGMLFPDNFIEVAESSGLIVPMGKWVLETACRQTRIWIESENRPLRIAVNLSAKQLERKDCSKTVQRILEKTELEAQFLELEITESMMMKYLEQAVITLEKLEKMGIQIAMDDFGTGYSSLSQLKRLPIHTLKIDKSFVRDISTDSEDAAIILAIISMANSLQLEVVAEGVELQEQLDFLRESGCRFMQGFYFSRPLPAKEFTDLLNQKNPFNNKDL